MRKELFCFLLVFLGCASDVPSGLLSPQKITPLVYDLMQVDEFINNTLIRDTTINQKKKRSTLYDQVFALHKTDRKTFYSSLTYYQQHPDLEKEVFDSVSAMVSRANSADSATKKPGQTQPASKPPKQHPGLLQKFKPKM